MKIEKIAISNFKGLRSAAFSPNTFSCLVGENNAGKSSVLQALVYALSRPTKLPVELYYDPNVPVEFRLEFEEVSERDLERLAEEHRSKIAPLIENERLVLLVRYRVDRRLDIRVQRRVPIEDRYKEEGIAGAFSSKRGAAIREALTTAYPEFLDGAPDALNVGDAKKYVSSKVRELGTENFTNEEGPLPSGMSSSIEALLPEPIYIPAVRNLADELKTGQSTSFGRLLGLLLADMTPDLETITASLERLNQLFNRVEEADGSIRDQRHAKVIELESAVERFLRGNFPTAKVELEVPPPELKAILSSAQVFIDDGSRDLIDNKGDGIKRALTFALLQCYVDKMNARADGAEQPSQRPLVFLFEEPELYLHPRSQRALFATLASIAQRHQVVVTTHSPLFFAPGITAGFVRVSKRQAQPKPVGHLFPVDFLLDTESAEVFRLARFENADAGFFSERVVLFEGESDDSYLKHVAGMLNPDWNAESKNLAMIRVSGKGNFSRFRRFFLAFGIEVRIVADLDAFFKDFEHLGLSKEVADLRTTAIQNIDRRVAALGTKPEPSARQIRDKVKSDSWKSRYERSRAALREVQQTQTVTPDLLEAIDGLFIWENDDARMRVCCEDEEARAALVPALDAARAEGVCILSKGAIEDYYPVGAATSGNKPDRAIQATRLVENRDSALALSRALASGRSPELVEVCGTLFQGLGHA